MKRSRQLLAIGALLVSGALVLGGCGGGGGKDKRLTKAEFAAKANTLCAEFTKKAGALGTPATVTEATATLNKYRSIFDQRLAETKKLKPPSDEQAAFDRILTIDGQLLGTIDRMIVAIKNNDRAGYNKLGKSGDVLDKEKNNLYRQLGAPQCAK